MACIVSTIRRISTPKFGYENPICPRASIHQSVSLILAFRVNGPSVRESGVVSKMLMLSGSASAYFVLPYRISEDPCLMPEGADDQALVLANALFSFSGTKVAQPVAKRGKAPAYAETLPVASPDGFNNSSKSGVESVSYTHLTLPTKA